MPMAAPQIEYGYTRIPNKLFDELCRIRIPGEARQVYDAIFRKTYGWNRKLDQIPLNQFVKMTGITRRNVVRAIKILECMNLIFVERKSEKVGGVDNDTTVVSEKTLHSTTTYGINENYDSWLVSKQTQGVVSKTTQGVVSKPDIRVVSKTTHSKESLSKESFKENILSGKPDDLPENSNNPKKQNAKIPFSEIIEHLNQTASKNFLAKSKSTQTHIKARFAEGFTLPDFITVINRKVSQWSDDPKMAAYLRPETLFGPKFEGYLNESESTTSSLNWMKEIRAGDPSFNADPKE